MMTECSTFHGCTLRVKETEDKLLENALEDHAANLISTRNLHYWKSP